MTSSEEMVLRLWMQQGPTFSSIASIVQRTGLSHHRVWEIIDNSRTEDRLYASRKDR